MAGAYAPATYQLGGYVLWVSRDDQMRMHQCVRTTLDMGYGRTVEVGMCAIHA
jgi:hypothetical protein